MVATTFSYRAVQSDGSVGTGFLEAPDHAAAIQSIRRNGARPILVAPVEPRKPGVTKVKTNAKMRTASINLIAELAVLLNAGLPLDRSLALAITNVEDAGIAAQFTDLLEEVRTGVPLSQAMHRRQDIFSPAAAAMAEAGEANGALGGALARLAAMLEGAEDLQRLIVTSMIYPIALTVIAVGVILLMLLFVVPQFESLFGQAKDKLPPASAFVMGASQFVRAWGWWILAGLISLGLLIRQLLARPATRAVTDQMVLRVPQLGMLVRYIETARFSRTLGVLIDGNVPLPNALALARRTIANSHIGGAITRVAEGVREGGGLAAPLAAANVFPKLAIGFLRTGEETSQLGPMLARLADVLDRDVKIRLQRLIGVLTPIITIILGATVASIIAAIMSAIIGFNELAISS
jgi:general secretion pathway protein F